MPRKLLAKARLLTLEALDGRTIASRRARDLAKQIETDLGGNLSAAQSELVTRAALLSAFCADQESRWLAGDDAVDLGAWLSAIDRQRRTFQALGLRRVPKPVPDLQAYLQEKYGADE
jgi:hypothetical protein